MKYLKKYFMNFRFVNRVIWLTIRQNINLAFSSEKKLGRKISEHNSNCNILNSNTVYRQYSKIEKKIDRLIDLMPLSKTCLIRTLVKADYFKLYLDVCLPINLGLAIHENEMNAHSWIAKNKADIADRKFIKVN